MLVFLDQPSLDGSFQVEAPPSPPPQLPDGSFNFQADGSFEVPDRNLEDTIGDGSETTFKLIDEGTKRGRSKLADSDGYSYTVKKKPYAVCWTCSRRQRGNKCPATVVEGNGVYWWGGHRYTHPPIMHAATNLQIQASVRMANKRRQALRPKDPEFDLQEEHIPAASSVLTSAKTGRHLVFATDHQLKLLARAKTWYMDATFKVVGKPFYELFGIHAFVREDDTEKQVLLAMVFMSNKDKKDYKKGNQRSQHWSWTLRGDVAGGAVSPAGEDKERVRLPLEAVYRKIQEFVYAEDIMLAAKASEVDSGDSEDIFPFCRGMEEKEETMMVNCCSNICKNSWYHLSCAGLQHAPQGDWFCSRACEENGTYIYCTAWVADHDLTWNRVTNLRGGPGGNIGLDLINEFLNNDFKGDVPIGEFIVPKTYKTYFMAEKSKRIPTRVTVIEGRKQPLLKLRQNLLQKQKPFLRDAVHHANMTTDQMKMRLEELGEEITGETEDQLRDHLITVGSTTLGWRSLRFPSLRAVGHRIKSSSSMQRRGVMTFLHCLFGSSQTFHDGSNGTHRHERSNSANSAAASTPAPSAIEQLREGLKLFDLLSVLESESHLAGSLLRRPGSWQPVLQFKVCPAGWKCYPVSNTCALTLTMPEHMTSLSQQEFDSAMEEAIEIMNLAQRTLKEAKDTRWLSHDEACSSLYKTLPAVLTSLDHEAPASIKLQAAAAADPQVNYVLALTHNTNVGEYKDDTRKIVKFISAPGQLVHCPFNPAHVVKCCKVEDHFRKCSKDASARDEIANNIARNGQRRRYRRASALGTFPSKIQNDGADNAAAGEDTGYNTM
ncbi:hypothetical protein Bbelb_051910 [Branchiostoma belcheri]|nr:hypothetical protein Bbelb_051910 [Branchiostoma belcheri]